MLYRVRLFIFVSLFCFSALANDPFKLAEDGKWDEVYKMLDAGTAQIDQRNGQGESFFDVAIRLSDLEAVTELVARGIHLVDLDQENLEEATAEFVDAEAYFSPERVPAVEDQVGPEDESPDWPRVVVTPFGVRPAAQRALDFTQRGENLGNGAFDCSLELSPVSK